MSRAWKKCLYIYVAVLCKESGVSIDYIMIKEEREEGVIEQWLLCANVSEVLWKKPAHRGVVTSLVTAALHKGVKMKVVPLRLIW